MLAAEPVGAGVRVRHAARHTRGRRAGQSAGLLPFDCHSGAAAGACCLALCCSHAEPRRVCPQAASGLAEALASLSGTFLGAAPLESLSATLHRHAFLPCEPDLWFSLVRTNRAGSGPVTGGCDALRRRLSRRRLPHTAKCATAPCARCCTRPTHCSRCCTAACARCWRLT